MALLSSRRLALDSPRSRALALIRALSLAHALATLATLTHSHPRGRACRALVRAKPTRARYIHSRHTRTGTRTGTRTHTRTGTHRQLPHTRGTYIVVTRTHTHLHTHTTPHPIRLRENCCKSAGQRHDIVVPGSKQTSRKNLYPYSYVVRIFLYPKGSSMDIQAVIEKVLEQYKRGLLTTEETRLEITEVLYTDLIRNTPSVSDFDVQA